MKKMKRRIAGIVLILMLVTIVLSPASFSAWADKTDEDSEIIYIEESEEVIADESETAGEDEEFDISCIIDSAGIVAEETDDAGKNEIKSFDEICSCKTGDIVRFGKYEQDGNAENGKEDIEWLVLDAEPERILVVSKYALDCQAYNTEYVDVTWETCTLREWLNNDFKNKAFSLQEQEMIPMVTVANADNPVFGTSNGNATEDQVFVLSLEEMEAYFGGYNWIGSNQKYGYNQNLICTPTQYAIDRGVYSHTITDSDYENKLKDKGYTSEAVGKCGVWWWLRSCGYLNREACGVNYFGDSGALYFGGVEYDKYAVRPALYINISYAVLQNTDSELDNPIALPEEEIQDAPIPGDEINDAESEDEKKEDGVEDKEVIIDEEDIADEDKEDSSEDKEEVIDEETDSEAEDEESSEKAEVNPASEDA